MKIRSVARPGDTTGAAKNMFIAVDELENKMGSCRAEPLYLGEMMPERPCEVKISAGGEGGAMMHLLGTALARGIALAKESGVNARVYAECAPDDEIRMSLYKTIGLFDDDALVKMSRCVVGGPNVVRLPEGCVLVADNLTDPQERAYFIERQKQLFGRENAAEWLEEIGRKPLMKRLLVISRKGLVGELVCWAEKGGKGCIGHVYTAPAWRRKGVALYLMGAARRYFYSCRLMESHVDVRIRMKAMMKVAASAGYRQSDVLMRLPGIDLDAPPPRIPL